VFRAFVTIYTNENLTESSLIHELHLYLDVGGVYSVVVDNNITYTVSANSLTIRGVRSLIFSTPTPLQCFKN